MPKTGFEPAHSCERCDLNTVRLPISPLGLNYKMRIANINNKPFQNISRYCHSEKKSYHH